MNWLLLKLKFPLSRYRIDGHSMEPTLRHGQIVWVNQWYYIFQKPRVGDIVLFKKGQKDFVKRLSKIVGKRLFVVGDNKADSFDSRFFGEINKRDLMGRVRY